MTADPPAILPRRELGRSGLTVTRLMFGGGPIGGLFAPVDNHAAQATLRAAWSAGVRAFDTAPHYGAGLSELRLGEFLAERPRAEYVVSTKVGRLLVPSAGSVDETEGFHGAPRLARVRDYSPAGVRSSLEASMRRLGLDRIDLALIHDPDDHALEALDGAYPALAGLRSEGVIQAIGIGMSQTGLLEWFLPRTDLDCVLIAGRYSLLDTGAGARLLPECRRRGVAVLAGGVFNSGILADPRRGARFDYLPASTEMIGRAQRIRQVCARHGLPIGAVALQFTLRHPAVTAAVVGVRSPAEVGADVSCLDIEVPDSVFDELVDEGLIPADAGGARLPSTRIAMSGSANREACVAGRAIASSAGPTWPARASPTSWPYFRHFRPETGTRHLVQDEPDPDWLRRPAVRHRLEAVGAAGLSYDLLIRPGQLPAAPRRGPARRRAVRARSRRQADHLLDYFGPRRLMSALTGRAAPSPQAGCRVIFTCSEVRD